MENIRNGTANIQRGTKMKKEDFIRRYGEEAYGKNLQQAREWGEKHPEQATANSKEQCCKGGKRYEHRLKYDSIGLRHDRNVIRHKHRGSYRPYKRIIAPDSVLHHEWAPETADYKGVALVEKDQHMHGFVDVIQILEGEITLLTEEEIRRG